jgi:hypothetical protein
MNASRTLHHSLIRVLLVLCLLVPAVARSIALYDITGSVEDTPFANKITATGQIHFVGDLSTDGTFSLHGQCRRRGLQPHVPLRRR